MTKFALEALEIFAENKATVMDIQRQRVKAPPLTHRDVASSGQKAIVESVSRDKAHRSHITEIHVAVIDQVQTMKNAISILRRDIKHRYAAALKKEYGAITNQHDGIEDHFSDVMRAIKEGDILLKIIDLVIADIDKGQLSDKDLQKTAQLLFHPGRSD